MSIDSLVRNLTRVSPRMTKSEVRRALEELVEPYVDKLNAYHFASHVCHGLCKEVYENIMAPKPPVIDKRTPIKKLKKRI